MRTSPVAERVGILFDPKSVVVIGASTDPTKLSGRPLPNLLRSKFAGRVYVVHPRAEEIEGVKCYPTLADIGEQVDVAIIVLSPDRAVDAAEECGKAGVKACIVGVSGFAEEGNAEGIARQARLSEIARTYDMVIVGPNTNGVYNGTIGVPLGYNSSHGEDFEPGGFSIVSHSGALFSVLAGRMRQLGVGLSKFISVGNECDLTLLDYTEYLLDDPDTRVIGMIVEAIDDGERFRRIARRAMELRKSIVVLKLGQTDEGARATSAHSSRLAGSSRAYSALFEDAGIAQVSSIESMVGAVRLLEEFPSPMGDGRLGAVTASGAASSILADTASRYGVPMAPLRQSTIDTLNALPNTAPVVNPVDIGAIGGPGRIADVFGAVASDGSVGAVLLYAHILQTMETRMLLARSTIEARRASGKIHVVLAPGGLTGEEEEAYREGGIPLFHDSAVCFEALRAIFRDHPTENAAPGTSGSTPLDLSGRGSLSELDSAALLARFDILTVPSVPAQDADAAVRAAESVGYPVVMKAIVTGVEHKSDLGLVELRLGDEAAVRSAFGRLEQASADAGDGPAVTVVQPMVSPGVEVIVGMTTEPGLGKFLVIGLGGIFAEALDDVILFPVPTPAATMRSRLERTTLGRVLTSPRWNQAAGIHEVVGVLTKLQALVQAGGDSIAAIDINPLTIVGDRVIALDALVVAGS